MTTIHEEIAALQAATDHDTDMGMRLERLDELVADRNEDVYIAAKNAAAELRAFAFESSEHLTCGEFEALLALYEALGENVTTWRYESGHAMLDDEGDEHYIGDENPDDTINWADPPISKGGPQ